MKKTNLLFSSLIATAMVSAGCSSNASSSPSRNYNANSPAPPHITGCTEWDWDGNQWHCEDGRLAHSYGGSHMFFYNGGMHRGSITNTKAFKAAHPNYKSSSSRSGSRVSSGSKSGGFGSGTRGGFSTGG